MSYVRDLQNHRKQQKNKMADLLVKYSLLAIVLFVVFFIVISFGLIIRASIVEVGSSDSLASWGEILFGSEFDMVGEFAMGIIVFNTIWMSMLVLALAAPVSIATALLITRVLNKNMRNIFIAMVSILAAIPSVVYGSFGKYVLLKFISMIGLSQNATDATLLAVIIIVAIMVMPTITLMTITSILLVDRKLEDSAEALGATKMQTSVYVTLRSARTGIVVGMLFALGRCIGEATAISMLSGEVAGASGITLSPFNTSLFLSPTIMGALGGVSQKEGNEFAYIVMSGLLLITVILLFVFAKFVEHSTDDVIKSKKLSKIAVSQTNLLRKIDKFGEDSLTKVEQSQYAKYLADHSYKPTNIALVRANEISSVYSRSSLDENKRHEAHKDSSSFMFKTLIMVFSMFGIISLFSIVLFLTSGDTSLLTNWEYLTSRGRVPSNTELFGLAMPMIGTMITIMAALIIALPLGIAIAVYTNTFMTKDTKLAAFISFAFQIMTSIPAVIYGTIAAIIFVEGGFIRSNFISVIPMLMLALVVLPTIIKQTQEGFRSIKSSQEEGAYALGASKTYTATRIVVAQSMPAILSAAILAISIVMADSAIMITIIGNTQTTNDINVWMQNGGYTLSTQIYWLSAKGNSGDISREIAKDQIKAIGLLLMLLIFWLTLISQKIKNKQIKGSAIMFAGIIMYMISFYIFGGVLILMILGPILGIFGAIYEMIFKGASR